MNSYRFVTLGHHYQRPELKELCRYSDAVSPFWKQLALELDFSYDTINKIDHDRAHITDKCYDMFNMWLERSLDTCWCHIVNAIKMCKKLKLAKDIEESFLGTYGEHMYEIIQYKYA